MGKRETGLRKRGQIWWVEKQIDGQRIRESTGTSDVNEARRYLTYRLNEIRRTDVYGERPYRSFDEAAAKFLLENRCRRSLNRDDQGLRMVLPFIGHLELGEIHYGKLQVFVDHRLKSGIANTTINRDLCPVRQVLKAAATQWFHDNGQPWLTAVPAIPRLTVQNNRTSNRVITHDEQNRLLRALPDYLSHMTLFALNTGCRRGEVMALNWAWQIENLPAFLIPPEYHKTGDSTGERLIVCNSTAWSVVEAQRGKHANFVFTRAGRPVKTFYGRAWKQARIKAGLPHVTVHALRHTYATRLASQSVSEADVGLLLGHSSGNVTRRYIAPDVSRLLQEAEKIVSMQREPVLRVVGETSTILPH